MTDGTAATQTAPETGTSSTQTETSVWGELSESQQNVLDSKKFANPGVALDSYASLTKMIGDRDKLISVPDSGDTKGLDEAFGKLGMPEKAEDYGFSPPEGKEAILTKELARKHRLTIDQASGLSADMFELEESRSTASEEAMQKAYEAEVTELKKEWGEDFEKNRKLADAAARTFGLSEEMLAKLDSETGKVSETVKLLVQVGKRLGEHNFIDGEGKASGPMSQKTARQRITEIKKGEDPDYTKKLFAGDKKTTDDYNRLFEMAYPSQSPR